MTNQHHSPNHATFVRFRRELCGSLHENDGMPYYLVEDPVRGGFYRMGVSEWKLANQLDGRTTMTDAIARVQIGCDGTAMTQKEVEATARSLLIAGLAEPVGPDGQVFRIASPAEPSAKLNPYFMRFPLIYPDRFLAKALPWLGWLISRPFLVVWLAIVIWGGCCISTQWQRFTESALIYLAPHTWVYLALVWCMLKITHEFLHGLVCKKYGGNVGSSGIALILFSPVAYAPEEVVRIATEGFVEQVHVAAGQRVIKNQLLVMMRSDELEAELAGAKLAVQQSIIRTRILHRDADMAAYQAELKQLEALKKRQSHLQSQVDELVLRAPMEGTVLGRRRQSLVGQFMEVGAPLLRVADESRKEIQVSIPEAHIHSFSQQVGRVPHVRVLGRRGKVRAGQLTRVEPRASVLLRQPALGGRNGGPLAVRNARMETTESGRPNVELLSPRFHGSILLPPDESLRLKAGQLAKVRVDDPKETLGRRTYRAVQRWIQKKLGQRRARAK